MEKSRSSVRARQSYLESIDMNWHRPYEGDRGDYESSVDSRAAQSPAVGASARCAEN